MSLSLPPETINATLETHDAINAWMDEHEIYGEERAKIHDLVDHTVRSAHLFAMAASGSRILTTAEVADRLGVSIDTVRKRLREASPPILPIKQVGTHRLFMVEDLPAIATAHMQGVAGDLQNTRYLAAKLRNAIAKVKHHATIKRLSKDATVRWPDIDGRIRIYQLEVARTEGDRMERAAIEDGWDNAEHLLRAFIVSYNELSKRKGRK